MSLVSKYNIPVSRYTSYPTVPFWDKTPTEEEWLKNVKQTFVATNKTDGISLHIHLPFCESLCTYCASNTRITVNHQVEIPYIETLIKEWQIYLNTFDEKPNIKEIHLGGGTPTFFSEENLYFLICEILKTATISSHAEFSFDAHPHNTTLEHLTTLYKLGFKRISFGIQDFDIKVQDAINRFQTYEEVENIVKLAREVGYKSVNFDFVYGLPFQTIDSIINTINKVIELKPERIAFYSYAHVPWIKPGEEKFKETDLPIDAIKRSLYEKGRELFLLNGYFEIGMDHFSLKHDLLYASLENKNLHRNFMGYTPHHTKLVIALGASSISDSWTGFIQNMKTVEEYQKAIGLGHLAIFKGHELSQEDLILRKHILNIMCNGSTNWKSKAEQCDEIYFVLERLKEMKKDGLVTIEPFELKVSTKGKAFLRNICMCFDARFWLKTPEAKTFSSVI
jgi:oxygen-independent coproporphyrinogen-3 oxidase